MLTDGSNGGETARVQGHRAGMARKGSIVENINVVYLNTALLRLLTHKE